MKFNNENFLEYNKFQKFCVDLKNQCTDINKQ